MEGHIVPVKLYFGIFATLLVMTAVTASVAYIDLGQWNTIVALIIACFKATLVALFFMHLRWSGSLMRVALLSALLALAILITFTTTDYFSRGWTPVPQEWGTASRTLTPAQPVDSPTIK